MKPVYVIGTCDTKEAELRYAVAQVGGEPAGVLTELGSGRVHCWTRISAR